MPNHTFKDLLEAWGERFTNQLRTELDKGDYPFSPGFGMNRPGQPKNKGNKNASGGLRDSIEFQVVGDEKSGWGIELYMNNYWRYVNDGVSPSKKYPSSGYISGGGTSPFISSLVQWFSDKLGITGKEALGRAFGARYNIWRYGVAPSYFYSNALEEIIPEMEEQFGDQYFEILQQIITSRVIKDIV